jgi:uncharacterized protein YsxB (DUF464 family)
MTNVVFKQKQGKFYCLHVQGHAMFNMKGPDILCSSMSMITQACANYISKDCPKEIYEYITDPITGTLYFEVFNNEKINDTKAQAAFEMTYDALVDLAKSPEFGKYINMEVFKHEY